MSFFVLAICYLCLSAFALFGGEPLAWLLITATALILGSECTPPDSSR